MSVIAEPGGLTPAEVRVAALMSEGLENAEIAQELSISLYTVKKQVSQVLFKLEARNRTHAVVKLLREGGAHRP